MRIPITRPILGTEEADAVAAVLASRFLVQGPQVAEFERHIAAALATISDRGPTR